MTMMFRRMVSEEQAVREVEEIVNSVLGKRWMVAAWCVEEGSDGKFALRLAGKVTWQFPAGDFDESLRLLRSCLDEETRSGGQTALPPPLELASFLRDRADGGDRGSLGDASQDQETRGER